jgi:hypothetical protein
LMANDKAVKAMPVFVPNIAAAIIAPGMII